MVRNVLLLSLMVIVFGAPNALQAGDEVTLSDGRVIAGEIISKSDAPTLRIRVTQGTMRAVMAFPVTEVVKVERGVNERLATLAALRSEVAAYHGVPFPHREGWWEQVQGFAALNEMIDYQAAVHEFLTVFPDFQAAREALGQQRYQGEWMTENEMKMAQGLIRYQGAWRSEEEVETLIAQDEALRAERAHQRDMRRAQRALEQQAARISRANQGAYQPFTYTHPLDRLGSPYYRNFSCSHNQNTYQRHSSGYHYQFGARGGHSSSNGFSFAFIWNN